MKKLCAFLLCAASVANAQYYNQTQIPIGTVIGTSGATIPLLNTANTWSALQTMTLGFTMSGATASINDSSNFNTNINTTTSTGTVTIGQNTSAPSSIVLKGPVSFQGGTAFTGASWLTVSPVFDAAAITLNDTTASGTVATAYAHTFQASTFTSTGGASTTITNVAGLWAALPVCSGGVVCSNIWGILTSGRLGGTLGATISGQSISLNASSNFATNVNTGTSNGALHLADGSGNNAIGIGNGTSVVTAIGAWTFNASTNNAFSVNTGTSTGAIHIGDGSGNNTITIGNGTGVTTIAGPHTISNATLKFTGVTTGTNADFLCLSATSVVLLQTSACTISSLRFKENVLAFRGDALGVLNGLEIRTFRMKKADKPNPDKNAYTEQIGLIAENIAKIEPRCAIYEQDMKTPKSYRQECVIALLVKGEQELVKQNTELKARLAKLEAR